MTRQKAAGGWWYAFLGCFTFFVVVGHHCQTTTTTTTIITITIITSTMVINNMMSTSSLPWAWFHAEAADTTTEPDTESASDGLANAVSDVANSAWDVELAGLAVGIEKVTK